MGLSLGTDGSQYGQVQYCTVQYSTVQPLIHYYLSLVNFFQVCTRWREHKDVQTHNGFLSQWTEAWFCKQFSYWSGWSDTSLLLVNFQVSKEEIEHMIGVLLTNGFENDRDESQAMKYWNILDQNTINKENYKARISLFED